MTNSTTCPTPGKIRYATREAADREARNLTALGHRTPYECGCGWWHITSQRPPKKPWVRPRRRTS